MAFSFVMKTQRLLVAITVLNILLLLFTLMKPKAAKGGKGDR
jgi:hypothetical protein